MTKNPSSQKVIKKRSNWIEWLLSFLFILYTVIFTQHFFCFFDFRKGTDATLLMKLNANHGNKSMFVKPFSDHAVSFGIRHFAGVVMYYSKGKDLPHEKNYFLIQMIKNFFYCFAQSKPQIRRVLFTCANYNLPSFIFRFNNFRKKKQFMLNFNLALLY